jgi:hypothetical protein
MTCTTLFQNFLQLSSKCWDALLKGSYMMCASVRRATLAFHWRNSPSLKICRVSWSWCARHHFRVSLVFINFSERIIQVTGGCTIEEVGETDTNLCLFNKSIFWRMKMITQQHYDWCIRSRYRLQIKAKRDEMVKPRRLTNKPQTRHFRPPQRTRRFNVSTKYTLLL